MNKRLIALVPAAVLALTLSACGSDDESGSSSESGTSSESSESSGGSDATGADYEGLISDFYDAGNALEEPAEGPEEFNEIADLPEGVTVESIDEATSSFCIQDSTKDISLALDGAEEGTVVLYDGLCEGGEEVARIVPEGQDDATVEGDEELGQPVADFFIETFGS